MYLVFPVIFSMMCILMVAREQYALQADNLTFSIPI
jgi:hypothetical protein